MRKNIFRNLLSSCLAALVGLLCACTPSTPSPREVNYTCAPGEIRLISFNIRMSTADDGTNNWANRRDAVLNFIEQEAPSVLGCQEVLPDQLAYISAAFPQYTAVGVGRDDGQDAGERMEIFYRNDIFEQVAYQTLWLSETPTEPSRGWDAACHRTVTVLHLREISTGKEFCYLNTHFDHVGPEARQHSAEMVARFVCDSLPADLPVILGGDLNSDINDPILAPVKEVMQTARDIADPTDRGGTFNAFGSAPGNIVLDHIFCRNIDPEHTPSFRTLRGEYGAPYISDHYPIMFTFYLQ